MCQCFIDHQCMANVLRSWCSKIINLLFVNKVWTFFVVNFMGPFSSYPQIAFCQCMINFQCICNNFCAFFAKILTLASWNVSKRSLSLNSQTLPPNSILSLTGLLLIRPRFSLLLQCLQFVASIGENYFLWFLYCCPFSHL